MLQITPIQTSPPRFNCTTALRGQTTPVLFGREINPERPLGLELAIARRFLERLGRPKNTP